MAETSWLDPEELRVVRAFSRSTRAMFLAFDRALQAAAGMPRAYFEILWLLDREPSRSMRMGDLALATSSQPSRISHAVERLERAGQVRRELCAEDRRGYHAVLTDEGRRALRAATPTYAQIIRRHLLDPLSADEREALVRIGETLLRALEAAPDRPPLSPAAR